MFCSCQLCSSKLSDWKPETDLNQPRTHVASGLAKSYCLPAQRTCLLGKTNMPSGQDPLLLDRTLMFSSQEANEEDQEIFQEIRRQNLVDKTARV